MRFDLFVVLLLAPDISAHVNVQTRYHEAIGIPLGKRIKEAEDKILSEKGSPRIVGGSIAPDNAHPFLGGLVLIFADIADTSICGSSLISWDRLTTAAHCWYDGWMLPDQIVVVLGSSFLFWGGTRIPTSYVITHPYWDPETLENDVAIIYLPYSVSPTDNIQLIDLPYKYLFESFEGERAVAVGYGKTSDLEEVVDVDTSANEVQLQVISVDECQTYFGFLSQSDTICTDGASGKGTCNGDSGGPLFVFRDGQRILIGISSFVSLYGCELGLPSGFTRVTGFINFISQNM